MGRMNLKLMQGIEESEQQIQKEKLPQEIPVPKAAEEKPTDKISDKAEKTPPKPKSSPKREKKKIMPKQVFSFRASLADIIVWKAYATATGEKMEHIGCMAMNEYIKKHKLAGAELTVFDAVREREENNKLEM